MIAVKTLEGVNFFWPIKIRKNTSVLPEGYDELITEEDYEQLISLNRDAYISHTNLELEEQFNRSGAALFRRIREKWQDMADKFAFENTQMQVKITTPQAKALAASFSEVIYYLNSNVPNQALIELAAIPRSEPFLTEERLSKMALELSTFIQENIS